ncbi:MAG: alpha/beta fold hydrolase [Xanthomonadales bacterium]|nr:alpha/beta fold hydrolase [Xanthomonadales bacterium]
MTVEEIRIPTVDGVMLGGTFHPTPQAVGVVVISSALGVPRQFYRALAEHLAQAGLAVLRYDYRGINGSGGDQVDPNDARMSDWGELDLDAALQYASDRCPGLPLVALGHSAGGQLLGLAARSAQLRAAVMISSASAWWRNYQGLQRWKIWLVFHLLIPLFCMGRSMFPARKLGISTVDVPAGVCRQWSRWGRLPGYLVDPAAGTETDGYRGLAVPLLAVSIEDDDYAPEPAVEALTAVYPGCQVERHHIGRGERIGHFGFFRPRQGAAHWDFLSDWLYKKCTSQEPDSELSAADAG